MVDCAAYQDMDLGERQRKAKQQLYKYFGVKESDASFKWTFSNWERFPNRDELPHKELPVEQLDEWSKGWKTIGERWQWHQMLKDANPSHICISTNHMLMIAAIRDDATSFEIMQSA